MDCRTSLRSFFCTDGKANPRRPKLLGRKKLNRNTFSRDRPPRRRPVLVYEAGRRSWQPKLAARTGCQSWPPYSQSGQTPKNPQNHKKIKILLHKWTAGPICPDRYGPYLSFSSGTSQEMSLSKPLESTQSWRGEAAPTLG